MLYEHVLSTLYSTAWALREDTLRTIERLLRQRSEGARFSPEQIRERIAEANASNGCVPITREACFIARGGDNVVPMQGTSGRRAAPAHAVALIPIVGLISQRSSLISEVSGPGVGASTQKLTQQFRWALDDPSVNAIVFDVDSPGGGVPGVPELASEIFEARKQKPIIASVNSMAASAAYWLAAAASLVVIPPSGRAGSIGVYMIHSDESEALKKGGLKISILKAGKFKTEGNPFEPLSDEARAGFMQQINDLYSMFVRSVAEGRGTTSAAVRSGYGQGRDLLGADAVKQNLADRLGTLDDVLATLGIQIGGSKRRAKIDRLALAARGSTSGTDRRHLQVALMRQEFDCGDDSAAMTRRRLQLGLMGQDVGAASESSSSSSAANWRRRQVELMQAQSSRSPAAMSRRHRQMELMRADTKD